MKKHKAFLVGLLIAEILIFFLFVWDPATYKIAPLEESLTALRQELQTVFWPTTEADKGTLKEALFNICTWITELPFYPVLAFAAVWAVPVLLVYSVAGDWMRSLYRRINARASQPPKQPDPSNWKSGLLPKFALDANEYHKKMTGNCAHPFRGEAGVRVQRFTGPLNKRDTVQMWDENNEIYINDVNEGSIRCRLMENGEVRVSAAGSMDTLRPYVPLVINRCSRTGDERTVCILTWLGGN